MKPTLAPRAGEPAATNFKESGSPAAPIAVEVYLDYECPPCAAFYQRIVPPLVAQYVLAGTVRLLHRDFPLPHHRYAAVAARYTNAAGRAGYYDAVDQVFKTLAVWSRDGNIDAQLAQVVPSEAMHKVRGLVDHDAALDATVADDIAMARRDQLNFVPAVVLVANGERRVLGHIASFGELKTQLDQLLPPPNAGAGYYAMRLSALVGGGGGPSGGLGGKVFAEDISDTSLGWLARRVELFHLPSVEVVKGAADDPKLPAASLAAVLVVNSYHHLTAHQAMAARILRALKPGGRLVIADYSLPAHRTESRAEQLKLHEIDPYLVRAELAEAGFQVLQTEDPFLKRRPDAKNGGGIANADMWLITAVRP